MVKISIIGAGNVATHLAIALSAHVRINSISAKTEKSALILAERIAKAHTSNSLLQIPVTTLDKLPTDSDYYLIAVNDDSIKDVVAATENLPGIWAHTSGSVGMQVFNGEKSNYGVFYPLQTFSKNARVDISTVPMLIEGSTSEVEKSLISLASLISKRVEIADSAQREAIHVAAVFACNFANLMWMEADRLMKESGAGDISLFRPLLNQTLGKLSEMSPADAMTGPARRGDRKIIDKHIEKLPEDLQEIYSLLSTQIIDHFSSSSHE